MSGEYVADSFATGGDVLEQENFLGGFSVFGGGVADTLDQTALSIGTAIAGPANPNAARWIGITIVFLVMVIALEFLGVLSCGPLHMAGVVSEGFCDSAALEVANSGPHLGYVSGLSHRDDNREGTGVGEDYWNIAGCADGGVEGFRRMESMSLPGSGTRNAVDTFVNTRETPYFSDVTNRVLRMENREKEAIRALAKINQERLRRQAERPDATVPWSDHWAEWKRANPLGEEQLGNF